MKARVILLLVVVSSAPALALHAETYVIAAGNDEGRPEEPRLRYAERDAENIGTVMRTLGGVDSENAIVLLGETAETFRNVILRTSARIRSAQTSGASESKLIIYYSGHADAEGLHLGPTSMPFEELKTIVESSPAKVRVLILDSCRSGGATQPKGARPAAPFHIKLEDRLEAEGLAILTSSALTEDSQESDLLRASFFTHHLLNALRGAADRNRDLKVTMSEAYGYAYQETLRSTGRTLSLQHPTYLYDIHGSGDFTLTHLIEQRGRVGTLDIEMEGTYLFFERDEDGPLIAEVVVTEAGASLLLAPGSYFVQRRTLSHYREASFDLSPRGRVRMDSLQYDEVSFARLVRKGEGARGPVSSISVIGGLRGPTLPNRSAAPTVSVAWGLDFARLSLGAGLRFSALEQRGIDRTIATDQTELGLKLELTHWFDNPFFSFGLGLMAEANWVHQSFESSGVAPTRNGVTTAFGGLLAVERNLIPRLALRLEGGPITTIMRRGVIRAGAAVDDEISTPLTYHLGFGIVGRL